MMNILGENIDSFKVKVARSGYGSSLNKLSENNDELVLLMTDSPILIEELKKCSEFKNALVLGSITFWGKTSYYLKPLHDVENAHKPMFGGNHALLPSGEKMKIHDRYETNEQYVAYSA